MSDAEHLARNGPVWFTTCAVNEGKFTVFGPFFTYEDAEDECWPGDPGVPCNVHRQRGGAHLIGRTVGATVNVVIPIRLPDDPLHDGATWRWHGLDTNQRAGVIDLASLLRISTP